MRASVLLVAAAMVGASCTGSPVSTATPGSSPTTASPTPIATSSPTPASSPIAVSCRLPVLISDVQSQNSRPGFLSLPDGFIQDATGSKGQIYDAALGRWIVAGRQGLAADGLAYAYVDGDTHQSKVHLVDLKNGADRVLATGGPWSVVGLQAEGIYLVRLTYGPPSQAFGSVATPQGLWLLPLADGQPRNLTTDHLNWTAVGGGAAWGTEFNQADPHPYGGDGGFAPNQVVRLNLVDRSLTTWLYREGMGVSVMGVDNSSAPFVESQNGLRHEVWRLLSADSSQLAWSGQSGELGPAAPIAFDGATVWMSSFIPSPPYYPAVYRWTSDGGMELVAQFNDRQVTVAGACA